MSRTPSVSRTASVSSTSSMSISSNTGKASSNASVSSGKTSPVKNGGTSTGIGMSKTTRSHVTRTASIKKPTEKSKDKEVAGPVAESSQARIIKKSIGNFNLKHMEFNYLFICLRINANIA